MGETKNEIVWTGGAERVVVFGFAPRNNANNVLVETQLHNVDLWHKTIGRDEVAALKACILALHDRVKKAEAGLERFREVVEAKLPEYAPSSNHDAAASLSRPHTHAYSRIDRELMPNEHEDPRVAEERRLVGLESHLASLRAELTALGKHVEDVERRAYDTFTKTEATAVANGNVDAIREIARDVGQLRGGLEAHKGTTRRAITALSNRLHELEDRDRPFGSGSSKGGVVAMTTGATPEGQRWIDDTERVVPSILRVGTVPSVPAMTLKEAAEMMGAPHKPQTIAEATLAQHRGLSQDVEPLEIAAAMCGRRGAPKVPGFYQGLDVSTSGPITFPVVGVQPVALRPSDDDPRDRAELLEELLAARLGSGNPSAPFDLATLRVPTSETDGTVVLIAEDGRLVITDDVGNNVGVAQLPPTSARLLARMLMQSADAEEAKGASPQAYEPDSEDGS